MLWAELADGSENIPTAARSARAKVILTEDMADRVNGVYNMTAVISPQWIEARDRVSAAAKKNSHLPPKNGQECRALGAVVSQSPDFGFTLRGRSMFATMLLLY